MLQAAPPPAVAPAPVAGVVVSADARVTLRCHVHADGTVSDCQVLDERPSGHGFGAAALKIATKFRTRPKTADGRPLSDGVVTIPIRFRAGDVLPPDAAPPAPPAPPG